MNKTFNYILLIIFAIALFMSFVKDEKHKVNSREVTGQVIEAVDFKLKTHAIEKSINKKELACIRQALWYEARGEPYEGILAVASVIHNRKQSKLYPDTYCEVIHQPKQFSYVHERQAKGLTLKVQPKPVELPIYDEINALAKKIVTGQFKPTLPTNTLWYHTIYVNPRWSRQKQKVAVIENHVFFTKPQRSS